MTLNVATCMWTAALSLLPRTLLRSVVGVCTLHAQMLFKRNYAVPFSVVWFVRTLVSSNCRTISQSRLHLFTLWSLSFLSLQVSATCLFLHKSMLRTWCSRASKRRAVRFAGVLHGRCGLHAEERWHWVRVTREIWEMKLLTLLPRLELGGSGTTHC